MTKKKGKLLSPKLLFPVLFVLLLATLVSAIVVVSPGSRTIECDQSTTFSYEIYTPNQPAVYNVKLYDKDSGALKYSYVNNGQTTSNPFSRTVTVTKAHYGECGDYTFKVSYVDSLGEQGVDDGDLTVYCCGPDCPPDGCYPWKDGCEIRDYYVDGQECVYDYSDRANDWFAAYQYYCFEDDVWQKRLYHDFYCQSNSCLDHVSWIDEQLVEDCGVDGCDAWEYYCEGDAVYRTRTCHDRGCSNSACFDITHTETEIVEDCYYEEEFCSDDSRMLETGFCNVQTAACDSDITEIYDCSLNDYNECLEGHLTHYYEETCFENAGLSECVEDLDVVLDCLDDSWCDGQEVCVENGDAHCEEGTPVDCSPYSFCSLEGCDYVPDDYHFTWDVSPGFTSVCLEDDWNVGHCTEDNRTWDHTCADDDLFDSVPLGGCSAECDEHVDCEDYCSDNVYFGSLGCDFNTCYCSYDPGMDCSDRNYYGEWEYYCEQDSLKKKRMYYYYVCDALEGCVEHSEWTDIQVVEDCYFTNDYCFEDEVWTETGFCNPSTLMCDSSDSFVENCYYDNTYCEGTEIWGETGFCIQGACDSDSGFIEDCLDDSWCDGQEICVENIGAHCEDGTPLSCTQYDLPEIGTCDNIPDDYIYTWDYAAGFESECIDDGWNSGYCTQGCYSYSHTCADNDLFDSVPLGGCGAECDEHVDCEDYCSDNVYFGSLGCDFNTCFCSYDPGMDCSDMNYYEEWEYYCEQDGLRKHRQHHYYLCDPVDGCEEHTEWADDQLVEDCYYEDTYCEETQVWGEIGFCNPSTLMCDSDSGFLEECYYYNEYCDGDIRTYEQGYCDEQVNAVCKNTFSPIEDCSDNYREDCEDTYYKHYYFEVCEEDAGLTSCVPNDIYFDCRDDSWCNGQEVCTEVGGVQCIGGTPASCDQYSFCELGGCEYIPDDYMYTWDFSPGFLSECVDDSWNIGHCTEDNRTWDHTCADNDLQDTVPLGGCNAECDEDVDCLASECEETFEDYCNQANNHLVEYDDDKTLDSTVVSNYTDNFCDFNSCFCTDNTVDCSPPDTNTYCVPGLCEAECDTNDDCDDENEFTIDTCNLENCGCEHQETECIDVNLSLDYAELDNWCGGDSKDVTFRANFSDDIYAYQGSCSQILPNYIYLEWYNVSMADLENATVFVEHKEINVDAWLEYHDGGGWVEVCDLPDVSTDTIDSCLLDLNLALDDIQLRLAFVSTTICHEELDWAYIKLTYCYYPEVIPEVESFVPAPVASSGGGGGGGGSFDDSRYWICGDWSDCVDGVKTQDCDHKFRSGVSKQNFEDCVVEEQGHGTSGTVELTITESGSGTDTFTGETKTFGFKMDEEEEELVGMGDVTGLTAGVKSSGIAGLLTGFTINWYAVVVILLTVLCLPLMFYFVSKK